MMHDRFYAEVLLEPSKETYNTAMTEKEWDRWRAKSMRWT